MRLFLASYRFGDHHTRFAELVGPGARIAVIAAAADAWPPAARASAVTSELAPLRRAGYDAEELDVRDFARSPRTLEQTLRTFDGVWVRGGNTFVLRAQLARTGADDVLEHLVRDGELVYAGYSAGAAVATPTLIGLMSPMTRRMCCLRAESSRCGRASDSSISRLFRTAAVRFSRILRPPQRLLPYLRRKRFRFGF